MQRDYEHGRTNERFDRRGGNEYANNREDDWRGHSTNRRGSGNEIRGENYDSREYERGGEQMGGDYEGQGWSSSSGRGERENAQWRGVGDDRNRSGAQEQRMRDGQDSDPGGWGGVVRQNLGRGGRSEDRGYGGQNWPSQNLDQQPGGRSQGSDGNRRSYEGEMTSGSQSTMSGRGPKNYKRSDDRIREDICETLTRNDRIDPSEVDIEVKEGEVTLSGSVQDKRTKRMIEDLVEDTSGVREVQNSIRIGGGDSPNKEGHNGNGNGEMRQKSSGSSNQDGSAHKSEQGNKGGLSSSLASSGSQKDGAQSSSESSSKKSATSSAR